MIIQISSHSQYRFPKVELPESFIKAQEALGEALGIGRVGKPQAFQFKRRKKGCEVWLRFYGGFSLNLSMEYGYKKNIAEGRAWAIEFARQHGFKAMEIKR